MTITPLTDVTLPHRAFHVAVADAGHVVAISRKGVGSLISPDQRTVVPFHVPFAQARFEQQHVALSPDGTVVAVGGGNGIILLKTPKLDQLGVLDVSAESSRFSANGLFWTCERFDAQTIVLEILDPKTWAKVARTQIGDPYGDSHVSLLRHPNKDSVVVWLAAGQDGQCLFWARQNEKTIVAERFSELVDTTWPSFSPSGEEFLVISNGELQRYRYPRGPQTGRMEWSTGDEDDQIGDFVSYVDADFALVQSNSGRLYVVDVETMTIDEEISIQGHEPRPISEIYPSLKGDRGLYSDCWLFLPLPNDRFLSIHQERSVPPDESNDHLLTWRIPAIE